MNTNHKNLKYKLKKDEYFSPKEALQEAKRINPINPPSVQKMDRIGVDKKNRCYQIVIYKIIKGGE